MTVRPARSVLLVALLLGAWPSRLPADVIHLKNGATVKADSWEARGDDLVIRQGQGRLVIPRSEVVRIDPEPRPAAPAPAAPAPPPADRQGAAPAPAATRDDLLQAADALRRRIADSPLVRAENTRQLVDVLDRLGTLAYKDKDYQEAITRFREALGYDSKSASAQFGLAAAYLASGQDLYARTTLDQALLDHPDDPDLNALLGDVYYGQERPEEALAAWQKSLQLRPNEGVKARIDKLRRERAVDSNYVRAEAAHFTLKYDGDAAGADLSGQILDYLEDRFRDLEGRFDYYPQQPIVVVLYPQRQFYEATQAEANVGGLFDGKIRVPIGGLRQIDGEARAVLVHELTHAFVHGKSHGTAPRWLHEGLAQYVEGRRTPPGVAAAIARDYRGAPDPDAWGNGFSYPTALSFVEYLVDRESWSRLVDALDLMGRGSSVDDALKTSTRDTLPELRRAWGESLAAAHLQ